MQEEVCTQPSSTTDWAIAQTCRQPGGRWLKLPHQSATSCQQLSSAPLILPMFLVPAALSRVTWWQLCETLGLSLMMPFRSITSTWKPERHSFGGSWCVFHWQCTFRYFYMKVLYTLYGCCQVLSFFCYIFSIYCYYYY